LSYFYYTKAHDKAVGKKYGYSFGKDLRMTGLRTMIQLRVDTNADKIAKLVAQLPDKQLNFALALAINRTMADIKKQTKEELAMGQGQKFKIRSAWTAKGIRSTPANKRNLEGVVGSIDKYMKRQEEGEKKSTKAGRGTHLAIPTINARRGKRELGRIAKGPRKLFDTNNKVFKQTVDGVYGIWRRRGKKRFPIDLMYTLTNGVAVEPRWNFGKTAEQLSKHVFDKHFIDALELALATQR